MIGLGFVGVGRLGESLIKDLPKVPALQLAAVMDARFDIATQVAEQYASPWFGSRLEDLLALPSVDAVVISTPNALHVPQAEAALRAGKHVLVQKPLALSCVDAEALLSLAREQRRLLFVDYSYRFLDTMHIFRSALGSARTVRGWFHNIYGPGADKAWFFDARLSGGGALVDLGVHLLDLGVWLLAPRQAAFVSASLGGDEIEHAATLHVGLDDVPFELSVSWNAALPLTEIGVEVHDDAGVARWENVDGSFFRFRTLRNGRVLAERETTLREDTLRAFLSAYVAGEAPAIDARVYALLDRAYGRSR